VDWQTVQYAQSANIARLILSKPLDGLKKLAGANFQVRKKYC
jgi:hypothetical protein